MDELLAEQIAYYQARAGEYDEWWLRRGRYALPPDLERRWFEDVAEAEAALREFAPTGRVLELACGTGLWTQHLVGYASAVTAVDASPEVIELNRAPHLTGGRRQRRELNDGRTFNISKRYWTAPELEADRRRRRWQAAARVTTNQMILVVTASA